MKQNPNLPGTPEEFIEANMGLAQSVAWKYYRVTLENPSGFDMDDILQVAYLGLIQAYERFNPKKHNDVRFSTYAVPTIEGLIRRHLRDYNTPIKPWREETKMVNKQKLGEPLTRLEQQKLNQSLAGRSVDSLDRTINSPDDQPITVGNTITCSLDDDFEKIVVRDFVSKLDPISQEYYTRRMVYDMSQVRVAEHLGVSQVAISRLEKKILNQAKEYGEMDAYESPLA